jgi:hypothetical protein
MPLKLPKPVLPAIFNLQRYQYCWHDHRSRRESCGFFTIYSAPNATSRSCRSGVSFDIVDHRISPGLPCPTVPGHSSIIHLHVCPISLGQVKLCYRADYLQISQLWASGNVTYINESNPAQLKSEMFARHFPAWQVVQLLCPCAWRHMQACHTRPRSKPNLAGTMASMAHAHRLWAPYAMLHRRASRLHASCCCLLARRAWFRERLFRSVTRSQAQA